MRTIPTVLGLLSLLMLPPKTSTAGEGLGADLKLLKAAPSVAELRQRLLAIGYSSDLIDKVAARKGPGDDRLLSLHALKRAESWQVNLDPDNEQEQVLQVLFQSETHAMEFKTAYLILVLDASAQGGKAGKVLGEYLFDVDGCDYASDKPMTLSFAPARGKRWKEVRFTVGQATSCGTYVEIATRRDVLAWNEKRGRLELSRGKAKTDGVDRMDLTRPSYGLCGNSGTRTARPGYLIGGEHFWHEGARNSHRGSRGRQQPHPQPLSRRDAWLMAAGFVVLRLPNWQILHDPDRVLFQIRRHLSAHLPAPLSLRALRGPAGEGLGGGWG